MKKIVSVFLVFAMLTATMLAIIPASADSNVDVVNFLPDGVLDQLKADLQSSTASLSGFVEVDPFVYTNSAVNRKIAGSKLLSITIPVKETKSADNGNFRFTLGVMRNDKVQANAVPSDWTKYPITIKGSDHGLTANNTAVYKFIKVDLSSYNITVDDDETLTFFAAGDTLIPLWVSATSSSPLKTTIQNQAPEFMGFAARAGNLGSAYFAQSDAAIIFDLELEKEKPVSAEDIDFTNYETRRLMPESVYNGIKTIYEGKEITTSDWVPSVAAFTPVNPAFQSRFAGTRLRTITLPINKTLATDSNGDLLFTIHTWKVNNLTSAGGRVNSWTLKIKPSDYGIEANKSNVYKFITVDLTSYNIVVAKDEVLSFFATTDTLLPGYSGGASSYFQTNFPEMMGFGACTGQESFTDNTWTTGVIFFDITYDVPVTDKYLELKNKMSGIEGEYNEDDYTADSYDDFDEALEKANAALNRGATPDSEFEAVMKELDDAIAALEKRADFTAINELVAKYENLSDKQYDPAGFPELEKAIADIKTAQKPKNAKNTSVADAAELLAALETAIANLNEYADFVPIDIKLSEIKKLNKDDYTADSWKALEEVIADITELQKDKNAYNDEAQQLLAELNTAFEALVKVEKTDEDTDSAIDEADKTDETEDVVSSDTVTDDTSSDDTSGEKKGCKSAIGATVVVMSATLALGATALLKKKEN